MLRRSLQAWNRVILLGVGGTATASERPAGVCRVPARGGGVPVTTRKSRRSFRWRRPFAKSWITGPAAVPAAGLCPAGACGFDGGLPALWRGFSGVFLAQAGLYRFRSFECLKTAPRPFLMLPDNPVLPCSYLLSGSLPVCRRNPAVRSRPSGCFAPASPPLVVAPYVVPACPVHYPGGRRQRNEQRRLNHCRGSSVNEEYSSIAFHPPLYPVRVAAYLVTHPAPAAGRRRHVQPFLQLSLRALQLVFPPSGSRRCPFHSLRQLLKLTGRYRMHLLTHHLP